jgi:alpha-glucosidase (family GH31 glycosyl hydrolase)
VYLPPGNWVGFVETGMKAQSWQGPATISVTTDLTSMPVFARSGAIIPMQPYADRGGALVPAALIIDVFAGADGRFELYEDGGDGLDYQMAVATTTALSYEDGAGRFVIAARAGSFATAPAARSYTIRFVGVAAPGGVSVDGAALGASGSDSYAYDAGARILTVTLAARPTTKPVALVLQ